MTTELPEQLRLVMRQWTTGVAVVTSRFGSRVHGLTANSFNSVSLYPPLVTVTLEDRTRTRDLVERSGVFAVTILSAGQKQIMDLFAGKMGREADRFAGWRCSRWKAVRPDRRRAGLSGLPGGCFSPAGQFHALSGRGAPAQLGERENRWCTITATSRGCRNHDRPSLHRKGSCC